MRHRNITLPDSFRTATRERAVLDDDGEPTGRTVTETYMPAQAWIIETKDGRRLPVHHDDTDKLFDAKVPISEDEDSSDSGAVLIKVRPADGDVRGEWSLTVAALARMLRLDAA